MISIIIVGYNSEKYLIDCIGSIFSSKYKNFKVIFVDNNSTDNSIALIKKMFPKVEIILSQNNIGFAAGNNIGIKKALEYKSDYIFLLNPDTIIDSMCLSSLIKKSDNNTILQPIILLHKNNLKTNLINTTGNYTNFLGITFCNNYKKPSQAAIEKEISTASGAAVLIPSEAIKKSGMFDESFFMYHEDVDMFWRMRLNGFNIKMVPEAIIWHKYSFGRNKRKFYYLERNRLLFMFKNFPLRYLIVISPALIINELFLIAYSIIGGWAKEKFLSYRDFNILRKNIKVNSQNPKNLKYKKYLGYKLSYPDSPLIFQFFITIYNFFLLIYWAIARLLI